ncbi:hypothetical protein SBY92_002477 [Candida maltosa Xu316]|uniref:Uncharacterized protein n=1 Tax=Candida maltosa (strain Xu316) TaxID=1245528 RepID=M3IIU3_CANMX|nr:hypothetical protein G210_3474 [Candida maltosa Xu316]
MSTYRSKRVIPSAINTPISIRAHNVKNVTGSDVERILTEFIDASELNISGKVTDETKTTGLAGNSESPAVLSQLKRIQRSLRGLPPIISEQPSVSKTSEEPDRQNKKIKFDDSDENDAKESEKNDEESEESEESESSEASEVEDKKRKREDKDKTDKKKKHKH